MQKSISTMRLLASLFLFVAIASAQVTTGTISGTVKDSTGAVLPGARVELLNEDTGTSRTVQSDSAGHYSASSLSLGNYRVTATQEGFQREVRSGIVLTVGREATVDLALSVGAVTQTVEVAGEAPVVETSTATVSGLVNGEQIRDLPLNGRNFVDLALLNPGVAYNRTGNSDPASGFSGQRLSVNGSRYDQNLYLIDGAVANSTAGDTGGATGGSVGVEGIREFRVLTHNFSAEYGRSSGAVVSVITRSGTNQLHGSLYEFVRNNIFDARDFFNVGALPAFRRNQFGAAVGGPIKKDRIFFFANYEGLRQRQATAVLSEVPDANARQGILPTGRVTVNPSIVPYLALYPLPNGTNFGDGTALLNVNFSQPTTEDYTLTRMDFHLSDKDNFYWRYIYDPSTNLSPNPVPTFGGTNEATHHFVALSETHVFSGSALNEIRFSFNRSVDVGNTFPLIPVSSSLSFVPGQPFGTISFSVQNVQTSVGGALSELGNSRNQPVINLQNLYEGTDSFNLVRGRHTLKFGIDVERSQYNGLGGSNFKGRFLFGGLAGLLAATPTRLDGAFLGAVPGGGYSSRERGFRRILFGPFIQDDFRVTSKLTLNLGLRYELFTDPTEVNGLSANLINITDKTSTVGAPFHTSKANFAPRAGLAWDPTGSGKTSIRLGAGVYYNEVDSRTWERLAATDYRFFTGYTIRNPTTFPLVPDPSTISLATASELTVENNLPTPTVIHYGLDIQRQLTSTVSVRLGYVGSHGYNETRATQQDIRVATILADGTKFFSANAPFINPNFSSIEQLRADAIDNYNGLQAVVQKTFGAGLLFQASYTYSKALSESDTAASSQVFNAGSYVTMDIADPGRDYGRSAYDQRHTFVFNGEYKMPWDKYLNGRAGKALLGGWAVNGVFEYGSGMPLNINLGFNNSQNGDPQTPDRPNLAPGASNNPTTGTTAGCAGIPAGQKLSTPDRWFDPCAFVVPTPGTFGNLGRSTVQGPDFNNVSFTLVKITSLTEHKQLQFRAEFFNLFNHPSFGLPNIQVLPASNGVHGGSEGVITTTVSQGRQIQLGLKLTF